jgi:hypothetical protein
MGNFRNLRLEDVPAWLIIFIGLLFIIVAGINLFYKWGNSWGMFFSGAGILWGILFLFSLKSRNDKNET